MYYLDVIQLKISHERSFIIKRVNSIRFFSFKVIFFILIFIIRNIYLAYDY